MSRLRRADAGVEGIEPPSKVLETSILPLNYTPSGAPTPNRTGIRGSASPYSILLSYGCLVIFYHKKMELRNYQLPPPPPPPPPPEDPPEKPLENPDELVVEVGVYADRNEFREEFR